MDSYIITGASRGIGLGIARAVVARGGRLVALARGHSPELAQLTAASAANRFISVDLADMGETSRVAESLFAALAADEGRNVYLFNNAGMVEPVAQAGTYDDAALARTIAVNLTATMQLGNAFARHFQHRAGDRRMLNISSGAGRKPYAGWSAYCASKAGVDMYSRCLGVEQAALASGIRVASIAPGIVDTAMQAALRTHTAADFPIVDQFIAYKATGQLNDADACGAELLRAMHDDRIGFGDLLDLRSFREAWV